LETVRAKECLRLLFVLVRVISWIACCAFLEKLSTKPQLHLLIHQGETTLSFTNFSSCIPI